MLSLLAAFLCLLSSAKGARVQYFVVQPAYLDGGAIKINKSTTAEIKTTFKVDITFQRNYTSLGWETVDMYVDVCAFYPKQNGEFDVVVFQPTTLIRVKSEDFPTDNPGLLTKTYTIEVIANHDLLNVTPFDRVGVFFKNGGRPEKIITNFLNTSAGIYKIKYIDVTGPPTNPPNNPPSNPPTAPFADHHPGSTMGSALILPNVRTLSPWIRESDDIPCAAPANCVAVGRAHDGDENGWTCYQYATLKAVDGLGVIVPGTITVESRTWAGFVRQSNSNFIAPPGYVITGRWHSGDENGWTSVQYGIVKFNGNTVTVTHAPWFADETKIIESSGQWYNTNERSIWVRTDHTGDEDNYTFYRPGTMQTQYSVNAPAGTPPVPGAVPLYAYYSSSRDDYYYDIAYYPEGPLNKDWQYKGIMCYVFPNNSTTGMQTAINMYLNIYIHDHYFSSVNSSIVTLGSGLYGILGTKFYASSAANSGLIPIYSYVSQNNKHALSVDLGATAQIIPGKNFYREGVAFYAYP